MHFFIIFLFITIVHAVQDFSSTWPKDGNHLGSTSKTAYSVPKHQFSTNLRPVPSSEDWSVDFYGKERDLQKVGDENERHEEQRRMNNEVITSGHSDVDKLIDSEVTASNEASNNKSAFKIKCTMFKTEGFVKLPLENKINIIGLSQHQIISNQAVISTAIENGYAFQNGNNNQVDTLKLDEIVEIKKYLPIEDPEIFQSFDNDMRNDKIFREKIWTYLQTFIDKHDWKKSVRKLICGMMTNMLQEMYSCKGQKGKMPFNKTFIYNIVEVAATKITVKKLRPTESAVKTYISEWLKQAKKRLEGNEKENSERNKKKKNTKANGKRRKRKRIIRI